jgi:cytochrome P450
MLIGSGLRDEAHFENPEVFNPERNVQANLAFGYGPHFCLGAPLARMETRVVLDVLLSQCERITLCNPEVHWNQALLTRAPAELPIQIVPR